MASKIVKSTERGQITLPKQWRDRMQTDNYVMEMKGEMLIITPLKLQEAEEVIFDADRDNDGKGIPVDEMLKMLTALKDG